MDLTTVYSKTAKGVQAITQKGKRLPADLARALSLVDGRATVEEILKEAAALPSSTLPQTLANLANDGYLKVVARAPLTEFSATPDISASMVVSETVDETFFRILAETNARKNLMKEAAANPQEARQKAQGEAAAMAEEEVMRRKNEARDAAKAEEHSRQEAVHRKIAGAMTQERAALLKARREADIQAHQEKVAQLEKEMADAAERARREAQEKATKEADIRAAERKAQKDAEERARQEALQRKIAEAMALEEAAIKVRREAEERTRKEREEAERKAREEADSRARREKMEKEKAEIEERMRREAQEEAATKARAEVSKQLRMEAQAREETERSKAREEAERKAREEAKEKARAEARKQFRLEARAREDAERVKAREDMEAKAKAEAEERAEAENRARLEDAEKARAEEEARIKAEVEAKAREEAERVAREEAERAADARAEEEARTEAEAEARAREEAERKTREEAEAREKRAAEVRAIVEAEEKVRAEEAARIKAETENRAREEAERKTREEAEARAIAETEERARREAEEKIRAQEEALSKARAEAERKAREEAAQEGRERSEIETRARALADARAEEAEKARQKTLAKPKKNKHPVKWGKNALISLAVLILLPLVLLHVMSLNIFIPPIEKLASDRMREPVSINSMHASLWPKPYLRLDGVTIGKLRDIKIPTLRVMPELTAFFGDTKTIKSIEVESLTIDQDVLARVIAWVGPGNGAEKIQVRRIAIKTATIEAKGLPLPPFEADIALAETGKFEQANIRSTDKKIEVAITPKNDGFEVNIAANDWQPPLWPSLTFTELRAKAMATSGSLRISEIEGRLYGGKAKGSATIKWGDFWSAEGDLNIENVLLAEAMSALTNDIALSGKLDAKTIYSMQSRDLGALFDAPRIKASFSVRDGSIGNIDLARAIQPQAMETTGGKTLFASLSGSMTLDGKRYQYRQMKLAAGLLSASGEADILPNKQLSGKTSVEMKLKSSTVRAHLTLSGDPKRPVLHK